MASRESDLLFRLDRGLGIVLLREFGRVKGSEESWAPHYVLWEGFPGK